MPNAVASPKWLNANGLRRRRAPTGPVIVVFFWTFYAGRPNILCMPHRRAVLDATEREFWLVISQAAFSNPFSEERHDLDLKIAGRFEGEFERVERLKQVVCERIERLEN